MALADEAPVLVPDAPDQPAQVLDARDLAAWMASAGTGCRGVVDAVGPVRTFGDVVSASCTVAEHAGAVVTLDPQWLEARGVQWWSGDRSLPLCLPTSGSAGVMSRSGARARAWAWGLVTRPLAATLVDTLADERGRGLDRPSAEPGVGPRDSGRIMS